MIWFAYGALALTTLMAIIRVLMGPSLADRIVALDVALLSLMGGIAVRAADEETTSGLYLVAVIAVIGFTATLAATRFIEAKGSGT